MSKKNFEPLNEFSGRLFFFFLKQEVGQTQSTPKGPIQFETSSSTIWHEPGGPKQRPCYPYASPKSQRLTHLPSKGEQ